MERRSFLRYLAAVGTVVLFLPTAEAENKETRKESIYHHGALYRGPKIPQVAVTIDDGWDPQEIEKVLQVVRKSKVPLTFFIVGKLLARSPWKELAKEALSLGCELQNHSLTHPFLARMSSREEIKKEILSAQDLIFRVSGGRGNSGRYLRPPYGSFDARVVEVANRFGLEVVMWSLSSEGTSRKPSGELIPSKAVLQNLASTRWGEIVLMHFNWNDVGSLGRYLAALGKDRLSPVLLSTLSPSRFAPQRRTEQGIKPI